ncbi:helix-turn-helix domain-containing protein [Sutcliffiella cohnii]
MYISSIELGSEIKKIRKKQSISQKELAEGICCQTTISYIEKGKTYPSIDLIYYIAIKLGVSIDYFFQKALSEKENYVFTTKQTIEELVKEKKYDDILDITKFERKLRSNRDLGSNFNQYIDWHYFRSAQLKGQVSYKTCVDELSNLINKRGKDKSHFQDLQIKNVIANVLSENGQESEAITLYHEIIEHEVPHNEYSKLKLKVYFNVAQLYVQIKEYNKAIKTAFEGIDYSIKLENMSMMGNLNLQIALSKYNLGEDNEEIKEYLYKAKFFYETLNRKWYVNFVDEFIKSYL